MKRLLPLLTFALLSCFPQPKEGPEPVVANQCKAPPEEYAAGKLLICEKNEHFFCCAYGMVMSDASICAHIVCQLAYSCMTDWNFYATECPPKEAQYEEETLYYTPDDFDYREEET